MELKGKSICFIGDSITQGCGTTDEKHCYVDLFIKNYPNQPIYKLGIGGTRIAEQLVKPYNPDAPIWDEKPFFKRIEDMPETTDLICIFGGTNDFGHGDAGMGKFGDTEVTTFYGALYKMTVDLINKYPNARIVFFTPLHRGNETEYKQKADGSYTLIDYVNAIKKHAEYFAIPVLDLYSVSGLQPNIPTIRDTFVPDQLHPNDAGHEKLYEVIENYLKSI